MSQRIPPVTDRNHDGSPVLMDEEQVIARLAYHFHGSDIEDLLAMDERAWDGAWAECYLDGETEVECSTAVQNSVICRVFREQIADRVARDERDERAHDEAEWMETGADRCPPRE